MIGPYQVVGAIGAGGMGEVFQATDTRLGREVALKIIPDAMAQDADRMARFEREARVLASLNHPNIAGLYGIEESDGRKALVMELVPGEDLSTRIDAGPLPLDEALNIALQVARALETAHLKGVIHRDLKPANVRLTPDGQVKVLDFGLAKPTGGDASSSIDAHLSQSPTFAHHATQAGIILGTAAYMSPEQARGRTVDARTDVFSFGCILFEMLSGTRAFAGEDISEILASVIKGDVQWSRFPESVPAPLRALLARCLAQRADERFQAIGDVRYELARFVADPALLAPPAAVAAAMTTDPGRPSPVMLAVAAAAVLTAGAFAFLWFTRPTPRAQTTRFAIEAAPDARAFLWPRLSPDGTMIAFLASDSTGARRIHIRRLDTVDAMPLAGTEDAGRPFWSPDGSALAFMVGDKLKKIEAGGGPVQLIAEARTRFDGSWGADGVILLDGGPGDSILAVSSTGGAVKPASVLDRARGELSHAWPSFLPDGKRFLFTVDQGASQLDLIRLGRLGSFATTIVDSCDSRVEYVAPGYILYARTGTLFGRRFDLAAGKCEGEPFPIVENLGNLANSGDFSGSLTGTIAYRARAGAGREQIVLVDRAGKLIQPVATPANYSELDPSPDGTRLAFSMVDDRSGTADIWVHDLRRGTTSRLTFDAADDVWPVWSPDGLEIAFASSRAGAFRIFTKYASGVGEERRVPGQTGAIHGADSWNASTGLLGVSYQGSSGDWNVKTMSPHDSIPSVTIAASPGAAETVAKLSPDGRWVALVSDESTLPQVYVQSYPIPSSRWQISTAPAKDPEWRADGRELFYRTLSDTIMAVPITPGETFEWGNAVPLFAAGAPQGRFVTSVWKPTADGQRFFVLRAQTVGRPAPITVVVDWAAEAGRRKSR